MESDLTLVLTAIAVLFSIFVSLFGLLVYSGLFATVEVRASKPPFGEIRVAYKFARGPYKNAGELFTEAHCLAPDLKCIGLYYDKPKAVAPSELRYVVGVMLESEDTEANREREKLLKSNGYAIIEFPAIDHAVTSVFPFKNTVSIFLAVARVYPKISEYVKERKLCAHPMIEVYDEDCIHFVAPLARQEEFYVPEAKEDHSDEDVSQDVTPTQPEQPQPPVVGTTTGTRNEDAGVPSQQDADPVIPEGEASRGSSSAGEESGGSSFEELNLDVEQ